jgi:hypothetical protein
MYAKKKKNLSYSHLVYQKSHMNQLGIEPVLQR